MIKRPNYNSGLREKPKTNTKAQQQIHMGGDSRYGNHDLDCNRSLMNAVGGLYLGK